MERSLAHRGARVCCTNTRSNMELAETTSAFGIGSDEMIAAPGTLVHLPAGTTHWFRFTAGGGEMVSMTSREGASHMFTDFDREIAPEAPDLQKLVTLGAQYGLKVPLDR